MKPGSFYRSTVETLIEALVLAARPFRGPGSQNQAGEGIGIMGEVYCIEKHKDLAMKSLKSLP
jgi:hypothetical protein